ncbi:MAG: hypothetical protein KAJ16_13580, partial [Calditrichia bacterium]|nr:hypothetical protein [Calditrichia bacterium]
PENNASLQSANLSRRLEVPPTCGDQIIHNLTSTEQRVTSIQHFNIRYSIFLNPYTSIPLYPITYTIYHIPSALFLLLLL